MRVAVTGSSGLIGTALGDHLRAAGHQVVPVVRRPPDPGQDAIAWDPAAGTIEAAGFEGLDAVVHLAGAGIGDARWTPERKRELVESRTTSTDLLARTLAGLDHPPPVLLSASAMGYYGDRGDEELTEASGPGHDFLADLCVEWEAATAPATQAGLRVVQFRTGLVLTRRGGALPKLLPLFRLGLGGKFGSGRQWWSWITLDDEISALTWLLEAEVSGPVNLVGPHPATNAELTKALGRALHRPAVLPVPRFGPGLLVGRELADALLFTSAKVRPAALEAAGYPFAHPDLDEALSSAL